MTVSYVNDLSDVFTALRYAIAHNRIMHLAMGFLFLLVLASNIRGLQPGHSLPVNVLTVAIMTAAPFLFAAVVTGGVLLALVFFRRDKTFLTTHRLTLAPEGLTEETDFNTSFFKWTGIHKVVRTRKHLFLFVSPGAAHVVPRRCIPEQREWDALYEYAATAIRGGGV